jgi:hypothetical protein
LCSSALCDDFLFSLLSSFRARDEISRLKTRQAQYDAIEAELKTLRDDHALGKSTLASTKRRNSALENENEQLR